MAYGNGHFFLLKDIFKNINKKNLTSLHSKNEILMPIKLLHAMYKSASTSKSINLRKNVNFSKLGK